MTHLTVPDESVHPYTRWPVQSALKRVFDCAAATAGVLLLWPLFVVIAVAIKLESAGPVFFRQERVGRGFLPFRIFKFRTMAVGRSGHLLTVGEDPRVTRVGRILRQLKFDELPQLLNVIIGDMSLVGPRPELPRYVSLFPDDYREILNVRPGMTDLASLEYHDEAQHLSQYSDPEAEYIRETLPHKLQLAKIGLRRSSLLFDLEIILRTVVRVGGGVSAADLSRTAARVLDRTRRVLGEMLLRHRRWIVAGVHLAFIPVAEYAAFWLRFDGDIPDRELGTFVRLLPWLVVIRGFTFVPFRLYEGLWRYTGVWDLRNIVLGVFTSSVLYYVIVYGVFEASWYPQSVFVISALILVFFMGGIRLAWRLYPELTRTGRGRRVLIVGAGDVGEQLVRDMKRHRRYRYEPVGFIDDDASKIGNHIHGVQVLGGRQQLPRVVADEQPDEVVVAMARPNPALTREIVSALAPFKVPITSVSGIDSPGAAISQIRPMSIDDLLTRAPVGLDRARVGSLIHGRRIMVTGAGGSIGSELCRQIAALSPASLILFERYENNLYAVANDLRDRDPGLEMHAIIGDVTDAARLHETMEQHAPQIIFHAAAHKHVPLMEQNPCEAVKNNILGTRRVAQAAERYGVERMILISTDKAVNPTSVMGATKRVAELIQQALSGSGRTRFVTVRFGNVLGSNGSVVPRFLDQIRAGGPVTVTDPEIRRYFMLIPEAVQLVLHAAALGAPGAVYVLEMGDQIKLVDMARNLIRLSGRIPDVDIPIEFVGLRPGEKLSEELVGAEERAEPSETEKILRVRSTNAPDWSVLSLQVAEIERLALLGDQQGVLHQLCWIVPTFAPVHGQYAAAAAADRANGRNRAPAAVDNRQSPVLDRRQSPRGGRRRSDRPQFPGSDLMQLTAQ